MVPPDLHYVEHWAEGNSAADTDTYHVVLSLHEGHRARHGSSY